MKDKATEKLVQAALLSLVKKGKDAWNKWARANPERQVDFSNIIFEEPVSFAGFQFLDDATVLVSDDFSAVRPSLPVRFRAARSSFRS